MNIGRIFEGVAIALDSLRANKVRAALTILGVAIGVMVVIAMASAITGINRSVSAMLETLGPKTFFVERFFQGGLDHQRRLRRIVPWRRNPWLTVDEAKMLQKLRTVREVTWREGTQRTRLLRRREPEECADHRIQPELGPFGRRNHHAGT